MYLVYESLYGELLYECDSTVIIGLYDSKEKAIKKIKEKIIENTSDDYNYVVDEDYVRLFYNYQENGNCHFEICMKKLEVE